MIFAGKAISLQARAGEKRIPLLWVYAEGLTGPRFEAPLAGLARKGVAQGLVDAWRDDLTTVAGGGLKADAPTVVARMGDQFNSGLAAKLVESALALARKL